MTIYFKPTWLYIKQHNKTGLKYFGKTTRDPHNYYGSGTRWLKHLKKHGYDVSTIWCHLFMTAESISEYALKFSAEHNIVESREWANLRPEDGMEGGSLPGKLRSEETKQRLSEIAKARTMSDFTKRKISESNTGIKRPRSSQHQENLTASLQGKCRAWNKGLKLDDEKYKVGGRKNKGNQPWLGLNHTDDSKNLMSEKAKNRERVCCNHCNKTMDKSNYVRWHGDNCKLK